MSKAKSSPCLNPDNNINKVECKYATACTKSSKSSITI